MCDEEKFNFHETSSKEGLDLDITLDEDLMRISLQNIHIKYENTFT